MAGPVGHARQRAHLHPNLTPNLHPNLTPDLHVGIDLRFAFVWLDRWDMPANVLTKVVAQNTAYFLGEENTLRPFAEYTELAG